MAQTSDTIYTSEKVIIIGDKSTIHSVSIKFEAYVSFEDFPVKNIYKGKQAAINCQSNPTAREYRTRISTTCKDQGVNFGGRYCSLFSGDVDLHVKAAR